MDSGAAESPADQACRAHQAAPGSVPAGPDPSHGAQAQNARGAGRVYHAAGVVACQNATVGGQHHRRGGSGTGQQDFDVGNGEVAYALVAYFMVLHLISLVG